MGYELGQRSLQNLSGVNPDLQDVIQRAIEITEKDFTVIEGVRNIDRQRELVKTGKSTTMNSRHLTGHAVDNITAIVGVEGMNTFQIFEAQPQDYVDELYQLREQYKNLYGV